MKYYIKNILATSLWVPATIKKPSDKPAGGLSSLNGQGLLGPGEEVVVESRTEAEVFAAQAGENRVKLTTK